MVCLNLQGVIRLDRQYRMLSVAVLCWLTFCHCTRLPKEKLYQFQPQIACEIDGATLHISVSNPIAAPLRVRLQGRNEASRALLDSLPLLVLAPFQDTAINMYTDLVNEDFSSAYGWTLGDPRDSIGDTTVSLPFPSGKTYKVIQGYHGKHSHNRPYSRYAIDFSLKTGDTVTAVADGIVVGVIEGYNVGGANRKYRDYANFITIYHPDSHLYTQYVHLKYQGSLVTLGDTILQGEPIGLSGMSGFTDVEHLHFNVLKATEDGIESTPISFREGYNGKDLQRGMTITKSKS